MARVVVWSRDGGACKWYNNVKLANHELNSENCSQFINRVNGHNNRRSDEKSYTTDRKHPPPSPQLSRQIINCTWDRRVANICVSVGCASSGHGDISLYADNMNNTWSAVDHIRIFCDAAGYPWPGIACGTDRIRIGFSTDLRRVTMEHLKWENWIVNMGVFCNAVAQCVCLCVCLCL